MRTLNPGAWYLMFVCEGCHIRQVLFPDLSDGKSQINATYTVDCPQCGHQGSYDSDHIQRYQHPAAAKQAVA
jgi:ribosomal protein S27E